MNILHSYKFTHSFRCRKHPEVSLVRRSLRVDAWNKGHRGPRTWMNMEEHGYQMMVQLITPEALGVVATVNKVLCCTIRLNSSVIQPFDPVVRLLSSDTLV